ncbi:MAG: hypothetical protein NT031_15940 [Planctomycetota bacterium]|nr:hypothetical protein [Planctomycetota bacterium]
MATRTVSVSMKAVRLSRAEFLAHPHARHYRDVVEDQRVRFDDWLEFFNDPGRQLRLQEAEMHHRRPALAGVVRELETHPAFQAVIRLKKDDTWRHRQAIGVIVKLIMEGHGWRRTGVKGFLGGTRPGGLSKFFRTAERYLPPA